MHLQRLGRSAAHQAAAPHQAAQNYLLPLTPAYIPQGIRGRPDQGNGAGRESFHTLTPSLESAQLWAQSPRAHAFRSSLKVSEVPASNREPRRTVVASQAPNRRSSVTAAASPAVASRTTPSSRKPLPDYFSMLLSTYFLSPPLPPSRVWMVICTTVATGWALFNASSRSGSLSHALLCARTHTLISLPRNLSRRSVEQNSTCLRIPQRRRTMCACPR